MFRVSGLGQQGLGFRGFGFKGGGGASKSHRPKPRSTEYGGGVGRNGLNGFLFN